jgi:hypothetical protein
MRSIVAPTPRVLPLLALLLGALASALPATATSYVAVSDENLLRQATVVAEVRVASVEAAPVKIGTSTDYQVDILRLLKGYTAGSSIVIRVVGGTRTDGMSLRVWGAPIFTEGERALLFLKERADGSYGILHLMLGAFHEVTSGGRQLAVRDLRETSEVRLLPGGKLAAGPSTDLPRDAGRFADWLADRVNGSPRPADYFVALPAGEKQSLREKFNLFLDKTNGNNLRWSEFDSGGSVTFLADSTGQGGLSDSGFPEFQTALAAWTQNSGTPIRYLYGGKTSVRLGLTSFDNVNTIVFGDPQNEIPGKFDCSKGGTLAMGGAWSSSSLTNRFNGKNYDVIQGADIVVNDGLECFFQASASPQKAAEELFGHELGHTLGLAHSSESPTETNFLLKDALMYAFLHDDGRGARFNLDDLNGIRTLYNPGAVVPEPPPVGPCKADAQHLCLLGNRFSVQLHWQNQFDGSTGVGRAVAATDVTGYFSFGDPANLELLVKILNFGSSIKVFYGELTNLHFTLTVTDTFTGTVKTYGNTAGDCGGIDQSFAGTSTSGASSLLSAELGAAKAVSGSCRPDAQTLCLLSGRFTVRVNWSNPGDGTSGKGGAKALSSIVGTFYFTDSTNVELMTKVIPFADRVVFFYGALSDLAYTIQVTDTLHGAVKTYQSAAGKLCGGLDNSAFAP